MRPLHCWLVALVVLLGTACTLEAQVDKSPLATWDPSKADSFTNSTVGSGTLDVAPGCVRLILDNQKTILLVWPAPTSWNSSSQAIEFVGVQGERVTLQDGDQITPGGSSAIGQPQFVSPPDPSCRADESFIVNSVRRMTD